MKNNRLVSFILIACLLLGVSLYAPTANAGTYKFDFDASSITDGVDVNFWYATDDVASSSNNGVIRFTADCADDARIVSQKQVFNRLSEDKVECLSASATMKITSIQEGARFGILIGLPYAFETVECAQSGFLWFENVSGGLKAGISWFDASGTEKVLAETNGKAVSLGKSFNITLSIYNDGSFNAKVGNAQLSGEKTELSAQGFLGFGQTGVSVAEISKLSAYAWGNDTPENINYVECFDHNEFNSLAIYSESAISSLGYKNGHVGGIVVRDNKLCFDNVEHGWVSTKFRYSNVELAFDLQIGRQTVKDKNGVNSTTVAQGFSVVFGADDYKSADSRPVELRFDHSNSDFAHPNVTSFLSVSVGGNVVHTVELPEELNIFSEKRSSDDVIRVRIAMIDGMLTVQFGMDGEMGFRTAMAYEMDAIALGYLQVVSNGYESAAPESSLTSLTIDNLTVTNFDINGMLNDVDFKSSIWDTSDFEYEDPWKTDAE